MVIMTISVGEAVVVRGLVVDAGVVGGKPVLPGVVVVDCAVDEVTGTIVVDVVSAENITNKK